MVEPSPKGQPTPPNRPTGANREMCAVDEVRSTTIWKVIWQLGRLGRHGFGWGVERSSPGWAGESQSQAKTLVNREWLALLCVCVGLVWFCGSFSFVSHIHCSLGLRKMVKISKIPYFYFIFYCIKADYDSIHQILKINFTTHKA